MNQGLLSVDEALAQLLAGARPVVGIEQVPTMAAAGRVLAQPQTSTMDVPPMDNSAMDGFAVRLSDLTSDQILKVALIEHLDVHLRVDLFEELHLAVLLGDQRLLHGG